MHLTSGSEFEDRHHTLYQAEFPETGDSRLEVITIGIQDVSCLYCEDLCGVGGELAIRGLGRKRRKAWEIWGRGRSRGRVLEGVTKRALDFLRVDKYAFEADGQEIQHRVHTVCKDFHRELITLADGHSFVLDASALDSVHDYYRKMSVIEISIPGDYFWR